MRGFLIKLAIGIAGLVALVFFGSIDISVLARTADRPGMLAIAFLCLLATIPISAFRWWLLLRGLNLPFTLMWSIVATFVSIFFNTFLPGAHGGDLVRLAMAFRHLGTGLNRLTFSIIADRLTGMVALLILGLALIPFLPPVYAVRLEWVAGIALAAGSASLILTLAYGDLLAGLAARLRGSIGLKIAQVVAELTAALRAYVAQPGMMFAAVLVSLAQWALVLCSLFVLGEAMQFKGLDWSGYAIAGVWSLAANSLPITPGGIGVGEAAFAHVATILSSSPAQASGFGTVFLAMRVLTVLLGVISILPWLMHRSDLRHGISAMKANDRSERTTATVAE